MSYFSLIVSATLTSALCAQQVPTSAPTTAPASQPGATTELDLRINPFVDLHYHVRARLEEPTGLPGPAGQPEAVEAARKMEAALGGRTEWGLIEPTLARCQTAAEAVEACARLPATYKLRSGTEVQIREGAVELARAYVGLEQDFRQSVWPEHRGVIENARDHIVSTLIPKQAACFQQILGHLDMKDPHLKIPVYLVADAPMPGGFTHRQRDQAGMCFVAVREPVESLIYETVMHEAIHVLDFATAKQDTALTALRKRLTAAGWGSPAPEFRDVPHALMFVESGEAIRRCLVPGHEHYGDMMGYYDAFPEIGRAVRPAWTEYLNGEISRDAALERIVTTLRPAKPPGP